MKKMKKSKNNIFNKYKQDLKKALEWSKERYKKIKKTSAIEIKKEILRDLRSQIDNERKKLKALNQ